MSEKPTQLAEFLRLYLRLRPHLKNIAIIAFAVALLATFVWLVSYRPTYTSEAIALVRPQQAEEPPTEERARRVPQLFPKPLGVADYVVLMKSDAILMAVADAFNADFAEGSPESAVSVGSLRTQLSATSRLEIKTPYAVSYYPTIEMRAASHTPEGAAALMQTWIAKVQDKTHDITYSTKEDVYAYLDSEYTQEREAVFALQQELNDAMREGGQRIQDLRRERSQLEESYEVETLTLLNTAADEWDATIAARESELNLPLISEMVYASTDRLNALTLTLADKNQRLAAARARLEAISRELQLYRDAPVADPRAPTYWTLGLPDAARDAAESDITEVEVPSTGVGPVSVLLSRDASRAKVDLESLPAEMEQLERLVDDVGDEIARLQTQYVMGDAELVGLMREKEDQLKTIGVQRNYGLENVQRESELVVANLTRDRLAIEERLKRDLETKLSVFTSLAESRLQARLAVANTMDEFQIVTGPSQPEGRGSARIVGFFVVIFVLTAMLVTGAYVIVFVFGDTLVNLGVTTEPKG